MIIYMHDITFHNNNYCIINPALAVWAEGAIILSMFFFLILCPLILGLLSKILSYKHPKSSNYSGIAGIVLAGCVGFIYAINSLLAGKIEKFAFPLSNINGAFSFSADELSYFFLVPIFFLSVLSAIYGKSYFDKHGESKQPWLSFNILAVSMVGVVISADAFSFLLFWEAMSLASFFLVLHERTKPEVRRSALIYLGFTQVGTAALLAYFLIMGNISGSYDFASFQHLDFGAITDILFALSLIGFGSKAGIIPLHIWLPEAHPAAPSHVSSLMSGIMIKMGIYGILRSIQILGISSLGWGIALVILGILSGIMGVLLALSQHDIKRLLAYHSVENIGIILIGIGLGVVGIAINSPVLAVFGFAGGLLHIINHALFKSLLFMSAGSVILQIHTKAIDKMGGLIKKMPLTALAFLIGAISICGIFPFNGFVSEFLIYFGAFSSLNDNFPALIILVISIVSLAFIGGMALLCFTKAFGIIFLGEPRKIDLDKVEESGYGMTVPMIILMLSCLLIGVFPALAPPLLFNPVKSLGLEMNQWPLVHSTISNLGIATVSFVIFFAIVFFARYFMTRKKTVAIGSTWDCGFARPNQRMQYTASSFVQPHVDLFHCVLRTHKDQTRLKRYFSKEMQLHTHTPDLFTDFIFIPLYRGLKKSLSATIHISRNIKGQAKNWAKLLRKSLEMVTVIQNGEPQLYVLYIVLVLIILLIVY